MKLTINIINLLLLAGATLLLLLTVLSGNSNHTPLNKVYFLKADTSNIPGAYATLAWTFWGVCDANDFNNCTYKPANPISPKDNWNTETNVPGDFISNRDTYYYLSVFAFSFTFVALGFTAIAFLIDFLGLCFVIIDKIVIWLTIFALFFVAGEAAFFTSVAVLAKQAFNSQGLYAHVPTAGLAVVWTTFVVILLITFITCHANILNSYKKHIERVRTQSAGQNTYYPPVDGAHAADDEQNDASSFIRSHPEAKDEDASSGGVRFFKIKRKENTNPSKISDEESL